MKKLKPHIHAEVIKAWADGHKIEYFNDLLNCWIIDLNPRWLETFQYRIYDPLREVKEAFERGEIVQFKDLYTKEWTDYKGFHGIEAIIDSFEWRVKPKEEGIKLGNNLNLIPFDRVNFDIYSVPENLRNTLHIINQYGEELAYREGGWRIVSFYSDDYLEHPIANWNDISNPKKLFDIDDWAYLTEDILTYKKGNVYRVEGFAQMGNYIVTNNGSINILIYILRKATKEEVLNAPNYDGTATNDDFPFEVGDTVIYKAGLPSFHAFKWGSDDIDRNELTIISNFRYPTKQEIKDSAKSKKDIDKYCQKTQRNLIYQQIESERIRQNEKWGEQNHKPIEWIGILTEEVGEVAKEAADYHFKNPYLNGQGELQDVLEDDVVQTIRLKDYRKELIQVAAVAVQMIECLDRNELKKEEI